ncbi:RNA methyltransferase [Psychromonas antarctica]|jgi:TrmH family RNA methyltransferase|uniref:RNA methyltransferase n=1 Tax=Psychromonas antarctica TaxID=67573 RepID=UPI001EE871E6|nr:RNA methyltransferase [Psychromonas antarctica]MCG6200184.1 RNA methyltransferase [Psychromonas antarctica]
MISKNQLKLIQALEQKKQRKKLGLFLVQGEKNVAELFNSTFIIKQLFATAPYINKNNSLLGEKGLVSVTVEATEEELKKAGTLVSNNSVVAVVQCQPAELPEIAANELVLVLDQVGDPGNLGTIIRVADWYGIEHIVCSPDCADFYNPKVIAATMGSFARVKISHTELPAYLMQQKKPIYGAFLEGDNIHKTALTQSAVIVMGSESHGISSEVAKFITDKITIPSFGKAESLNVAMATGIILDNFKR